LLESKRRAIIFFVIAILLAALSGYFILQKVKELNADLGTMVNVYVSNKEIHSRALITPDDITTTEIPAKYLRKEYITDIDEFVNSVSVVPLSEGQIITRNMLKTASTVTEEDHRLITILQAENTFFDEVLYDMDRVDIVVSHEVNGEDVTEVFMTDLKVVRVAEKDGEFSGVQVEVPFDDITELIHMQHYAETFRVIRANVGQMPTEGESSIGDVNDDSTNNTNEETEQEDTEEPVESEG
jgi:Flp pilus assembly protein CpaB